MAPRPRLLYQLSWNKDVWGDNVVSIDLEQASPSARSQSLEREVRMKTRSVVGAVLILLGLAGIFFGVRGWTSERELLDSGIIDVTFTERETSPLLAALGGISLVT